MTMEIHHGITTPTSPTSTRPSAKAPNLDGKRPRNSANNPAIVPEKIRTAVRNNGGGHQSFALLGNPQPGRKTKCPIGNLLGQE
jgi:Fe-Mn family superoxide dismutase